MALSSESLLKHRQQPLLELLNTEENYVCLLQTVCDTYMQVVNADGLSRQTTLLRGDGSSTAGCQSPTLSRTDPPSPTNELAVKWRVIWGNWRHLTEWHCQFLEKLRHAVYNQPDKVPSLFLNARTRMRSLYMKYCENYTKAILVVAPHKAYFEQLRVYFLDKNDILSRLMQPIQRVTRYQLPMIEALKLTKDAAAPDIQVWRDAVAVLKDLPNDVQLMLEASRITGFSGSVTSLGNLRLFGAMYVARTTLAAQTEVRRVQGRLVTSSSTDSGHAAHAKRKGTSPTRITRNNSEHKSMTCDSCKSLNKATKKLTSLHFSECRVFLFDQALLITEDATPSSTALSTEQSRGLGGLGSGGCWGFPSSFGRVVQGSGSWAHRVSSGTEDVQDPRQQPRRPPAMSVVLCDADDAPVFSANHATSHSYCSPGAGRSPALRRTISVRRNGSHLSCGGNSSTDVESRGAAWTRLGWSTPNDPFGQSSYKFMHSVKANKMTVMPHWISTDIYLPHIITDRVCCNDHHFAFPRRIHSTLSSPVTRRNVFFSAAQSPYNHVEEDEQFSEDAENREEPVSPITRLNVYGSRSQSEFAHFGKALDTDRRATKCGYKSPHMLWFSIGDESPGSKIVYVFDPGSETARTTWLWELMEILEMQAEIQMVLQNPLRYYCTTGARKHVKTLSSTDMTTLLELQREQHVSLSAYTPTTKSVEDLEPGNTQDSEDGPIHFRGISAPHTFYVDQGKTSSDIPSFEGWSGPLPHRSYHSHLSANNSDACSIPDILQTPDDVFLPAFPVPSPSEHVNNCLNTLEDTNRCYQRRRSLSHGAIDRKSTDRSEIGSRSIIVRQCVIHSSTSSPGSVSLGTPAHTLALSPRKKLISSISSRFRQSGQSFSGMLRNNQSRRSASTCRGDRITSRVHRRLFHWSLADKADSGTCSVDTVKPSVPAVPPPRPPRPTLPDMLCIPRSELPATQSEATGCSVELSSKLMPLQSPPTIKAPSMTILNRLRLSFGAARHQLQRMPATPPSQKSNCLSISASDIT